MQALLAGFVSQSKALNKRMTRFGCGAIQGEGVIEAVRGGDLKKLRVILDGNPAAANQPLPVCRHTEGVSLHTQLSFFVDW